MSDDRRRWVGLLVALLVAVLATAVAPAAWPSGPGRLELSSGGALVAGADVEVGSPEPVVLHGSTAVGDVTVDVDSGVLPGEVVEARLRVVRVGTVVRPALDTFTLALRLSDGQLEPLPVLRWDPEGEVLVAQRRPPRDAAVALALLAGAIVLWVTLAVPLFATALAIPVVLAASGTSDAVRALAPFFNPIIALFFAGFLLAEAMRRVHLDRWAANRLVGIAGGRPLGLYAAMLATAAFLSMWMSNTAAVAVLLPIALAVGAPVGHAGFTRALVLGTAWAASIGGVGSAIGTPANLLAIEFLGTFDVRRITFAEWFAYGLPMVLLFLPVIAAWVWWRHDVHVDEATLEDVRAVVRAQRSEVVFGRDQRRVLYAFLLVAAGWLTEGWHGVDAGVVALGGVLLLTLTRDVREEDLGAINWTALLTFGGGLSLGVALTDTGVADWVASRVGGLASLPDAVAVAVVAAVTLALTMVASNTASAATLIPLAIPLAGVLGIDVTLLVVVVAIASSIDFALIIGTPPTMLAYATGLFTPAEILRRGLVLDLLGLALLVTAVPAIWSLLGVV